MKAYTDGACRLSNPGLCSCAFVLYDTHNVLELAHASRYLGHQLNTNNYAEYQGVLLCLEYLHSMGLRGVEIYCDSKLVVCQVNQKWQISKPELRPMAAKAFGLLTIGGHRLWHVKGHNGDPGNERADQLCNECLDAHMEAYAASKA